MSLINFTHPPNFDTAGEMEADQWNNPLDVVEGVFQSGLHGENFQGASIRGESFRKRGLTEVFRRRSSGDPWICWPTGNENRADIPGGALRFRLRAPASVMVFFSAAIYRHNTRDLSLTKHSLFKTNVNRNPTRQLANFYGSFSGYWEGENKEPGDEYLQASAIIRLRSSYDRPDVSKGVFLPWKIRPMDGTTAKPLQDLRMFDYSMPNLGLPEATLLQAGWHNIRHTAGLLATDSGDPALVIKDTELVVVADYGPTQTGIEYDDKHREGDALRGRVDS